MPINIFRGGLNPHWWSKGLTLWAPFDRVDDPLKLHRGVGALSFTRATTATFLNPDTGLIEIADADVLRIEADGALIEGARTNLITCSEWGIGGGGTVTPNQIAAPDGNTTADKAQAPGDAWLSRTLALAANSDPYVISFFVKKGTADSVQLWLDQYTGSWGTGQHLTYTFDTEVAVASGNPLGYGVIPYPDGWVRLWISFTNPPDTTLIQTALNINHGGSADAFTYVWGAQVEAGAFPSSYIPTTTVAVTRNADALYIAKVGNLLDTAGTFVTQFDTNQLRSLTPVWARIADMGGTPPLAVIQNDSLPVAGSDGTNYPNGPSGFSANDLFLTAGIVWGSGVTQIATSGLLGTEAAYDGAWTDAPIYIGSTAVGSVLWGHVKNLRVWNRALSDSELQLITTP